MKLFSVFLVPKYNFKLKNAKTAVLLKACGLRGLQKSKHCLKLYLSLLLHWVYSPRSLYLAIEKLRSQGIFFSLNPFKAYSALRVPNLYL